MNNFDIGIIGAGVAGAFATLKIAKEHKDVSAVVFDLGRPPMKRRRQLEGWLGCFPNSDGKLYLNDISKVSDLIGSKKAKSCNTWFNNILSNIDDFKISKDKAPISSMDKKIKSAGYDIYLNDYIQTYPKDIHSLSKHMADVIDKSENVTFSFDNEVKSICKQKNMFIITSDLGEFKCKKLIIAVGRSGWRWCKDLYSNFGIIDNNDFGKFGFKVEIAASHMKDFNKSNCTLNKDEIEIGPLNWFGTVVPEDHLDVAISAFRSNENRWKSDKVSFNLIGSRHFPNNGFEQTDRLSKLTFILANDRIIREKVSLFLSGKSKISIIPEYDWLKNAINDFSSLIPEITTKGYFHVPTIIPMVPKINIGTNLESEIDGMFVAGESAGVSGILSAAIMGIACADNVCK